MVGEEMAKEGWRSKALVKLTKIYTRMGDKGSTVLGDGEHVPKFSLRVAAYGGVDEANAAVGFAVVEAPDKLCPLLTSVQQDLFDVGADLCVPIEGGEAPREGAAGDAGAGGPD